MSKNLVGPNLVKSERDDDMCISPQSILHSPKRPNSKAKVNLFSGPISHNW